MWKCGNLEIWKSGHVADFCAAAHAELGVGPVRFRDRPPVAIEARDRWRAVALDRPGGPADTRAAAEIVDGPRRLRVDRPDDRLDGEEVERPVEQGEGRALARAF